MIERNPYTPRASVPAGTARAIQALLTATTYAWYFFVFGLTLFNVYYAPFLVQATLRAEISPLELGAILAASAMLPLAAVVFLVRRQATAFLWCSLAISLVAVFPAIWYHMVLSTLLSIAGLGLVWARARTSKNQRNHANNNGA